MRTVLFLDLDDTILQTLPKCPPGQAVYPAAYRRDGTPVSYMTDRQRAFLEVWLKTAVVIPTTARDHDAFRRVDLPFRDHAILNFGGVVLLPDGSVDAAWDARVRPRVLALADEIHAWRAAIQRFVDQHQLGASVRVISDFDMPLYVVVKHPHGELAPLKRIRTELLGDGKHERFFVHHNHNNLSLVPAFLGKERAVRHVIDCRLGSEPFVTVGMGDSLTDGPFMELCDFYVIPPGSQLARQRSTSSEGA